MEFIKSNSVIIALVVIILVTCLISSIRTSNKETFSDYINLEKFNDQSQLNKIEGGVEEIQQSLQEQQDMSKFALKSEIKPQPICQVRNAIDKDNYISKTVAAQDKCPVPNDYDPSKYILKSAAQKPQSCPACPTIDSSKYVLKSTLPVSQKCPDCKCPKVTVTAGLCKNVVDPPKCPPPKPCPVVKCPAPKACPPAPECPACPKPEPCPPKICPPCPAHPTQKACPKCCDREVVKILKKTIYVDQNGNQIKADETLSTQEVPKKKVSDQELEHSTLYTTPNAITSTSPSQLRAQLKTQNNANHNNANHNNSNNSNNNNANNNNDDNTLESQNNADGDDLINQNNAHSSGMTQNSMTPEAKSWFSSLFSGLQTESQGLATPAPTLSASNSLAGSTSLSGSLEDQSTAGTSHDETQPEFNGSQEAPLVQNYNLRQEQQKQRQCKGSPFNHEFKQFGVYGRNN